jgi:hypothetical protein
MQLYEVQKEAFMIFCLKYIDNARSTKYENNAVGILS